MRAATRSRYESRLRCFLRRVEDLLEDRDLIGWRRVAFEGTNVGVNVFGAHVAERLRRIIRHAGRRLHRRRVRAGAQKRDETRFGGQVRRPVRDKCASTGLAVVSMARVARVVEVELLALYGIARYRARRRDRKSTRLN